MIKDSKVLAIQNPQAVCYSTQSPAEIQLPPKKNCLPRLVNQNSINIGWLKLTLLWKGISCHKSRLTAVLLFLV